MTVTSGPVSLIGHSGRFGVPCSDPMTVNSILLKMNSMVDGGRGVGDGVRVFLSLSLSLSLSLQSLHPSH